MKFTDHILQRYEILCEFYLQGIWETVPDDLMRLRPHPNVNSIVWNLWHLTRVDDAGLNRFVVDRSQILDEGRWMEKMDAPYRHHGSGMTFPEVDELSQRIDLAALHDYSRAVQARTREVVLQLELEQLPEILQPERVRMIVVDEGLAHSQADELEVNYTGWTRGRYLMTFCLTHPYQHLGEIGVIASLLGVEF